MICSLCPWCLGKGVTDLEGKRTSVGVVVRVSDVLE